MNEMRGDSGIQAHLTGAKAGHATPSSPGFCLEDPKVLGKQEAINAIQIWGWKALENVAPC